MPMHSHERTRFFLRLSLVTSCLVLPKRGRDVFSLIISFADDVPKFVSESIAMASKRSASSPPRADTPRPMVGEEKRPRGEGEFLRPPSPRPQSGIVLLFSYIPLVVNMSFLKPAGKFQDPSRVSQEGVPSFLCVRLFVRESPLLLAPWWLPERLWPTAVLRLPKVDFPDDILPRMVPSTSLELGLNRNTLHRRGLVFAG